MDWDEKRLLSVLDGCCDSFSFPMLDNGYVYLAATRLSLYRSPDDWALVIEVFGYSPRSGVPDTHVYTFSSRIRRQKGPADFETGEAYETYLANNPHNESEFVFPLDRDAWIEIDDEEFLVEDASEFVLRGERRPLPQAQDYEAAGVQLEEAPEILAFEATRAIASLHREAVLATAEERRVCVRPELEHLLTLDEWHHPDVIEETVRPSGSETFQQLARVLIAGDIGAYQPTQSPNTHWSNWPGGGTL